MVTYSFEVIGFRRHITKSSSKFNRGPSLEWQPAADYHRFEQLYYYNGIKYIIECKSK